MDRGENMGEEEGEFEVLAYVLKSGVRDLSLNKFLDLTDFLCTSNSQLSTGLLEDPSPWHWHLRVPKHPVASRVDMSCFMSAQQ